MTVSGKTDIGRVRSANQDNFLIVNDGSYLLAAVCDGMGGHAGGNIASELAVSAIESKLKSEQNALSVIERKPEKLMTTLINYANESVFSKSILNSELRGMGTTAVMALVVGGTVYIAHVGDSRAYILFSDTLKRVTKDHSVVQEMIDVGEITEQEADVHPYKHVITRVLGIAPDVKIDISSYPAADCKKIFLCSDGLTNMLSDSDIMNIISEELTPEELCDKLVYAANDNGGQDNITAVIADMTVTL